MGGISCYLKWIYNRLNTYLQWNTNSPASTKTYLNTGYRSLRLNSNTHHTHFMKYETKCYGAISTFKHTPKTNLSFFTAGLSQPFFINDIIDCDENILQNIVQLNFVMSKWSGPRKILRHRNGSRQPIGHNGERNTLEKYQF